MSSPNQTRALKAVRGTRDLLPDQTPLWNHVESTARQVFARYGFGEIRTPVFEDTSLFARGVGEETDIVSKEMFTWNDVDRFLRRALEDKWMVANKDQIYYNTPQNGMSADLVVHRFGIGRTELIEFKARATSQDIDRLNSAVLLEASRPKQANREHPFGILVVPSGKVQLPSSYQIPENVRIEQIDGDFFESSQSLTLRPENTAGVVRSYIEHNMAARGLLNKLYYIGPQFRRERPQRGRYRQFWQIGAEVIGPPSSGSESALRDAEVLEMLAALLDELGVRGWELHLNSVGSAEDRARYNDALRAALADVKHTMCTDCQRRAETNPLRVLDCKVPEDQLVIDALPQIAEFLSDAARAHFEAVKTALDACGVRYSLNPRLVRGLDYYTRTTFEFTVTSGLGTQNALLGGGRYDGLSELLGGPRAPGIGFAIGEDRLILTLQAQAEEDSASSEPGAPHLRSMEMWAAAKLDAYIAPLGEAQNPAALALARSLRSAGLSVEVGDGRFKLRKSFELADAVARHIVLLGEDEAATQVYTVKTFASGVQVKAPAAELLAVLSI